MAPVAPIEFEAPLEIAGNIPAQRDCAEIEPVKLGVDPANTSGAPPPTPVAVTVTNRATKAELLRRDRSWRKLPARCCRGACSRTARLQCDPTGDGGGCRSVRRLGQPPAEMAQIGIHGMQPFGPRRWLVALRMRNSGPIPPGRASPRPRQTTLADAETSSSSTDPGKSTSRQPSPPRRRTTSVIGGPTRTTRARSR
jgi:hypothetical protein